MDKINLQERYKFRLSNGDWLSDILENHLNLMRVNGLDLIGCLKSGRLIKERNLSKTQGGQKWNIQRKTIIRERKK